MEHEIDASILETKWETEMMQIKKKKTHKKVKILFLMAKSTYINFLFYNPSLPVFCM